MNILGSTHRLLDTSPHPDAEPNLGSVSRVPRVIQVCGTIATIGGTLALLGYGLNIESLYRPIAAGPATHPSTAICFVFLGLSLLLQNPNRCHPQIQLLSAISTIPITLGRIYDLLQGTGSETLIPLFQAQVIQDIQQGQSNSMGLNSALMLLLVATSLVLSLLRRFDLAQGIAFITLAIPSVTFIGYAYGLHDFYGAMSPVTATLGFALVSGALLITRDYGALHAIYSPYVGGKIARFQILSSVMVPLALGAYLVSSSYEKTNLMGLFVIAHCWANILIITVSAVYQEKLDEIRRSNELQLYELATTDPLTTLHNRRKFFEDAQALAQQHREQSQTHRPDPPRLWILILDIDFFKQINDRAGHDMGDRVLTIIAQKLKQSVHHTDLVGRIGGEEFAILLRDIVASPRGQDASEVQRIADQIRRNIGILEVPGWTDQYHPVTVSIGGAVHQIHTSLEKTIKQADQALYQAKRQGRNTVVIAQAAAPPSPATVQSDYLESQHS